LVVFPGSREQSLGCLDDMTDAIQAMQHISSSKSFLLLTKGRSTNKLYSFLYFVTFLVRSIFIQWPTETDVSSLTTQPPVFLHLTSPASDSNYTMTISVAAAAPECMAFFSDAGGLTPKQYIAYSPMLQSCLCLKNLAKLYKTADSLIKKTHKHISKNVGKI
jgi:hypothetical protein